MTTPNPEREALRPCPFCGATELEFLEGSTFRWLAYSCTGCGIGSEVRKQTLGEGTQEEWAEQAKRDAVKAWNTRAQASAEDARDAARYRAFRCGLDWYDIGLFRVDWVNECRIN